MRRLLPGRKWGDKRSEDIQHVINEQPTTVTVTRAVGNTLTGTRTQSTVATFECRLDMMSMGPRHLIERDRTGRSVNTTYRLLAQPVQDRLGRVIDVVAGDTVTESGSGEVYRVLYVKKLGYMHDVIVETSQGV